MAEISKNYIVNYEVNMNLGNVVDQFKSMATNIENITGPIEKMQQTVDRLRSSLQTLATQKELKLKPQIDLSGFRKGIFEMERAIRAASIRMHRDIQGAMSGTGPSKEPIMKPREAELISKINAASKRFERYKRGAEKLYGSAKLNQAGLYDSFTGDTKILRKGLTAVQQKTKKVILDAYRERAISTMNIRRAELNRLTNELQDYYGISEGKEIAQYVKQHGTDTRDRQWLTKNAQQKTGKAVRQAILKNVDTTSIPINLEVSGAQIQQQLNALAPKPTLYVDVKLTTTSGIPQQLQKTIGMTGEQGKGVGVSTKSIQTRLAKMTGMKPLKSTRPSYIVPNWTDGDESQYQSLVKERQSREAVLAQKNDELRKAEEQKKNYIGSKTSEERRKLNGAYNKALIGVKQAEKELTQSNERLSSLQDRRVTFNNYKEMNGLLQKGALNAEEQARLNTLKQNLASYRTEPAKSSSITSTERILKATTSQLAKYHAIRQNVRMKTGLWRNGLTPEARPISVPTVTPNISVIPATQPVSTVLQSVSQPINTVVNPDLSGVAAKIAEFKAPHIISTIDGVLNSAQIESLCANCKPVITATIQATIDTKGIPQQIQKAIGMVGEQGKGVGNGTISTQWSKKAVGKKSIPQPANSVPVFTATDEQNLNRMFDEREDLEKRLTKVRSSIKSHQTVSRNAQNPDQYIAKHLQPLYDEDNRITKEIDQKTKGINSLWDKRMNHIVGRTLSHDETIAATNAQSTIDDLQNRLKLNKGQNERLNAAQKTIDDLRAVRKTESPLQSFKPIHRNRKGIAIPNKPIAPTVPPIPSTPIAEQSPLGGITIPVTADMSKVTSVQQWEQKNQSWQTIQDNINKLQDKQFQSIVARPLNQQEITRGRYLQRSIAQWTESENQGTITEANKQKLAEARSEFAKSFPLAQKAKPVTIPPVTPTVTPTVTPPVKPTVVPPVIPTVTPTATAPVKPVKTANLAKSAKQGYNVPVTAQVKFAQGTINKLQQLSRVTTRKPIAVNLTLNIDQAVAKLNDFIKLVQSKNPQNINLTATGSASGKSSAARGSGARTRSTSQAAPTGFTGSGKNRMYFGENAPSGSYAQSGYHWEKISNTLPYLNNEQIKGYQNALATQERALGLNKRYSTTFNRLTAEQKKINKLLNSQSRLLSARDMAMLDYEDKIARLQAPLAKAKAHLDKVEKKYNLRPSESNLEALNNAKANLNAINGQIAGYQQRLTAWQTLPSRVQAMQTQAANLQKGVTAVQAKLSASEAGVKTSNQSVSRYTKGYKLAKNGPTKAEIQAQQAAKQAEQLAMQQQIASQNQILPYVKSQSQLNMMVKNRKFFEAAMKSTGINPFAGEGVSNDQMLKYLRGVSAEMVNRGVAIPWALQSQINAYANPKVKGYAGNKGGGWYANNQSTYDRARKWAYPFTGNTSFGARTPMAVEMAKGMGVMYALGGGMSVISDAFSQAVEYENIMRTTKAILQNGTKTYTRSGFEDMAATIRDVGVKTKFSAPEVASASKFLAMAGYDIDAINKSIRPIADLALIGDADLGETADKMTNIMTTFGIQPDKMREAANIMTAVFTRTNTDLMMLAESAKYGGGMANLYGKNDPNLFADTMAIFGVMGNAGIQASSAGTALRMMYQNIYRPNKNQQKAWDELREKYGIAAKTEDGKNVPLLNILTEMSNKIPEKEMADYVGRMFRITAQAGAASVLEAARSDEGIAEALNEAGGGEEGAKQIIRETNAVVDAMVEKEGAISKLLEVATAARNAVNTNISGNVSEEKQNTLKGLWAQATSMFTEGVLRALESNQGQFEGILKDLRDYMADPKTMKMIRDLLDLVVSIGKVMATFAEVWAKMYSFAPGLVKAWVTAQLLFTQVGSLISPFVALIGTINRLKSVITTLTGIEFASGGAAVAGGAARNVAGSAAGAAAAGVAGNVTNSIPAHISPNVRAKEHSKEVVKRGKSIYGGWHKAGRSFASGLKGAATWGTTVFSLISVKNMLLGLLKGIAGSIGGLLGLLVNPITLVVGALVGAGIGLRKLNNYINGTSVEQVEAAKKTHAAVENSIKTLKQESQWYNELMPNQHREVIKVQSNKLIDEDILKVKRERNERTAKYGYILDNYGKNASRQSIDDFIAQYQKYISEDNVARLAVGGDNAGLKKGRTPLTKSNSPVLDGYVRSMRGEQKSYEEQMKDNQRRLIPQAFMIAGAQSEVSKEATNKIIEAYKKYKNINDKSYREEVSTIIGEAVKNQNNKPSSRNLSIRQFDAIKDFNTFDQYAEYYLGIQNYLESFAYGVSNTPIAQMEARRKVANEKLVAYSDEWKKTVSDILSGFEVVQDIYDTNNKFLGQANIVLTSIPDSGKINTADIIAQIQDKIEAYDGSLTTLIQAIVEIYNKLANLGVLPKDKYGLRNMVGESLENNTPAWRDASAAWSYYQKIKHPQVFGKISFEEWKKAYFAKDEDGPVETQFGGKLYRHFVNIYTKEYLKDLAESVAGYGDKMDVSGRRELGIWNIGGKTASAVSDTIKAVAPSVIGDTISNANQTVQDTIPKTVNDTIKRTSTSITNDTAKAIAPAVTPTIKYTTVPDTTVAVPSKGDEAIAPPPPIKVSAQDSAEDVRSRALQLSNAIDVIEWKKVEGNNTVESFVKSNQEVLKSLVSNPSIDKPALYDALYQQIKYAEMSEKTGLQLYSKIKPDEWPKGWGEYFNSSIIPQNQLEDRKNSFANLSTQPIGYMYDSQFGTIKAKTVTDWSRRMFAQKFIDGLYAQQEKASIPMPPPPIASLESDTVKNITIKKGSGIKFTAPSVTVEQNPYSNPYQATSTTTINKGERNLSINMQGGSLVNIENMQGDPNDPQFKSMMIGCFVDALKMVFPATDRVLFDGRAMG